MLAFRGLTPPATNRRPSGAMRRTPRHRSLVLPPRLPSPSEPRAPHTTTSVDQVTLPAVNDILSAAAWLDSVRSQDRTSTAMRRRSRTRRVLKWVGVLSCTLIWLTWRGSTRYHVEYFGRHLCIGMSEGCATLVYASKPRATARIGWWAGKPPMRMQASLPGFERIRRSAQPSAWLCWLPLWIPLAVAVIPTALLWRDRRRSPAAATDPDAVFCRVLKWVGLAVCLPIMLSESITGVSPHYPVFEVMFVANVAATSYLWWRDDQYVPPGHCQHCGYDLTGNVSGRCPECGTPVSNEKATHGNG